MAKEILTLASMCGGGVQERINRALAKISDNILDPNTEAKKKRVLTVKIELTPNEDDREDETKILHGDLNYMDIFMRKPTKGKRFGMGMKTGFPMSGKCQINRSVKVKPIKDFLKSIDDDIVQYIGLAVDEPERLARIRIPDAPKISLLEKYGYTEQMAYDLCKQYDLLSPIYNFAPRGGCRFCPNARDNELRHLRKCHPELWQKLLDLENEPNLIGNIWNTLTKTSIHSKEEQFFWEDQQMTIFDFMKG